MIFLPILCTSIISPQSWGKAAFPLPSECVARPEELYMKTIMSYDLMETFRNTKEWMGASARAMASYPVWGLAPHPKFKIMSAWGRVTEAPIYLTCPK